MIGETVSHYRIIEKLGEGGMGIVYLAEDVKLGRRVALKLLPQDRMRSPEARARFVHEAQTAASLNHPNICTIHEVDEVGDLVFLAMEHIEGESLTERIARGPLKTEEAVGTAVAIAQGLGAAHSAGIVHRDIKPGNVMLTGDGRAKVLDFGLALAPEMTRLTREGRTTGTVSYMSPEQSRGESVDHRTDIWSLGVVLYEMLTGQRPFAGDHEQAVLFSIMNDEPQAPSGLRTGVPLELERIIAKAMSKNPEHRYQHVEDLIVDLKGVSRSSSSQMTAQTGVGTRTSRRPAGRRTGARAMAIAAVIVVLVLAALWGYTNGPWKTPGVAEAPEQDRVVVAAFENRAGDPSLDHISHSLATTVAEGLASTGVVEVIPYAPGGAASEEMQQGDGSVALALEEARSAGASVLVTGYFHVRDQTLHVDTSVLKADDGSAINIITDETGPLAAPEVATDKVRSRVMGSLAARADPTIGEYARSHAPTYEAYREYQSAMGCFGISGRRALEHTERALELDPEFDYARVMKVAALLSVDRFTEADSLIQDIRSSSTEMSPLARGYMDFFEARLSGDHEQALRKAREMVRLEPGHFMGGRLLAASAMRVNRPHEAIQSFEQLLSEGTETGLYIDSWVDGGLANAYHMLGEYERELDVLEAAVVRYPDLLWLRARQTRALAGLGRLDEIKRVIEEARASPAGRSTVGYVLSIARSELRAHGHPEEAAEYAEQAVDWYRSRIEAEGATESLMNSLALSLYSGGRWGEARELFGALSREHPDEIDYAGAIATLAARAGDVERAESIQDSLLAIDDPYDFGMNIYWAACISAQLGRKEEAITHLRESHAQGAALELHVHTDVDLEPLWGYPPFRRFLEPRD